MLDWRELEVEPTGSSSGFCDCCGNETRRVWGAIHQGDFTLAAYFITWTDRKPDHGANFDFVLGQWGDGSCSKDRYATSAELKLIDGKSQFMVIDSESRLSKDSLFDTYLARSEVIGTPIAAQLFALIDAVYMSENLTEIREWSAH